MKNISVKKIIFIIFGRLDTIFAGITFYFLFSLLVSVKVRQNNRNCFKVL
jgi:hypothetical protein